MVSLRLALEKRKNMIDTLQDRGEAAALRTEIKVLQDQAGATETELKREINRLQSMLASQV